MVWGLCLFFNWANNTKQKAGVYFHCHMQNLPTTSTLPPHCFPTLVIWVGRAEGRESCENDSRVAVGCLLFDVAVRALLDVLGSANNMAVFSLNRYSLCRWAEWCYVAASGTRDTARITQYFSLDQQNHLSVPRNPVCQTPRRKSQIQGKCCHPEYVCLA